MSVLDQIVDAASDKELADAVVALGVITRGGSFSEGKYVLYDTSGEPREPLTAKQAVRDWRVAEALMEKVLPNAIQVTKWFDHPAAQVGDPRSERYENESLPRAIIEACVEALSNG